MAPASLLRFVAPRAWLFNRSTIHWGHQSIYLRVGDACAGLAAHRSAQTEDALLGSVEPALDAARARILPLLLTQSGTGNSLGIPNPMADSSSNDSVPAQACIPALVASVRPLLGHTANRGIRYMRATLSSRYGSPLPIAEAPWSKISVAEIFNHRATR